MTFEERKNTLTEEEKRVLLEGETERPFTGELLNEKREGNFTCKLCGAVLFDSHTKFDSGSGWPSFDDAIKGSILYVEDHSLGMTRTEVKCAKCFAHLGHLFNDGVTETGKRYCINSVCLDFKQEGK